MSNMTFGVNLIPKTNNTYTLGDSTKKWNLFVNQINGVDYSAATSNIVVTTTNVSASDALTAAALSNSLQDGQIVFVILNAAMAGSAAATIQFGSATAIPIYRTNTETLTATYASGMILGLLYYNNKLIMLNSALAA